MTLRTNSIPNWKLTDEKAMKNAERASIEFVGTCEGVVSSVLWKDNKLFTLLSTLEVPRSNIKKHDKRTKDLKSPFLVK